MITLTDAHIKELEAFIQDLPTKYGVPLIQFLNSVAKEGKDVPAKPTDDEEIKE